MLYSKIIWKVFKYVCFWTSTLRIDLVGEWDAGNLSEKKTLLDIPAIYAYEICIYDLLQKYDIASEFRTRIQKEPPYLAHSNTHLVGWDDAKLYMCSDSWKK